MNSRMEDSTASASDTSGIDERDPLIIAPHLNLLDPTSSINNGLNVYVPHLLETNASYLHMEKVIAPHYETLHVFKLLSLSPTHKPVLASGYPGYRYVQSEDAGIDGGIVLMLTISFLSSISFSVALPSLWKYVTSLGGHIVDLGWAIALHSVGTIVASPVLIGWARRRNIRETLVGSLIVMAAGGIVHGFAMNIAMLLVARFIVGIGSANYVITAIQRTRNRALLFNGITSIVGFTLGPAFAVSFTTFDIKRHPFSLDSCTTPGFFIGVLAICAAIFTMCTSMKFLKKNRRNKRKKPRIESYDPSNPHPLFNSASYDISGSILNYGMASSGYLYADTGSIHEVPAMLRDLWSNRSRLPLSQLIACLFVYFAIAIAFTIWETLGPALTLSELSWGVRYNGLLYVGMGLIAGVTLLILKGLTQFFVGRLVLPGTATLMASGAVVLCVLAKHWTIAPFIASIALISIGYTGSVSMVIHVYGKVLELSSDIPSSAMGWLSTVGSIARVLGPVCSAYLYRATSTPFWLMVGAAAWPSAAMICVIVMYRRLPP